MCFLACFSRLCVASDSNYSLRVIEIAAPSTFNNNNNIREGIFYWRFTKREIDDCSSMCLLACLIWLIVCYFRFKLLATSNLLANKIEIAGRSTFNNNNILEGIFVSPGASLRERSLSSIGIVIVRLACYASKYLAVVGLRPKIPSQKKYLMGMRPNIPFIIRSIDAKFKKNTSLSKYFKTNTVTHNMFSQRFWLRLILIFNFIHSFFFF